MKDGEVRELFDASRARRGGTAGTGRRPATDELESELLGQSLDIAQLVAERDELSRATATHCRRLCQLPPAHGKRARADPEECNARLACAARADCRRLRAGAREHSGRSVGNQRCQRHPPHRAEARVRAREPGCPQNRCARAALRSFGARGGRAGSGQCRRTWSSRFIRTATRSGISSCARSWCGWAICPAHNIATTTDERKFTER